MPRGGRRPGAGRKPGVPNKKKSVVSVRALVSGMTPLDVLLSSMRQLYEDKDYPNAALVAARAAPYVHQKFTATEALAKPHPEQMFQDDLFDMPAQPEGKKAEAAAAASAALADPASGWSELLNRAKH